MNWRWLWLDFVPKGLVLGPEERAAVRRRAREDMTPGGPEGMGVFVIAVVMVVPWLLVVLWLMEQATRLRLPAITPLPLALAGFWIIGVLALGPVLARATYRELRRRGHDVCVHCGHRWHDAAVADVVGPDQDPARDPDECPECANPRSG